MQDIIGKPQSWRSGKTKQRNKKPTFSIGSDEAELPIKKEEAEAEPRQQDGQAAAPIKREREAL